MTCDDTIYMAPLHLAGRLIMENGGETYRVEETITRMGHAFGFNEVECFAVPSGIFISYRKADGAIETAVKRIRKKGIDLTRVDAVNAVSRRMEQERLTCEEVMSLLKEIEHRPAKISRLGLTAAVAMSSFGWAAMFGGGMMDCIVAFAVALLGQGLAFALDKAGMRSFVSTLLGSFLGTSNNVKALDTLPYHIMGITKYEELDIPYPLKGIEPATKKQAMVAKQIILTAYWKEKKKQAQ